MSELKKNLPFMKWLILKTKLDYSNLTYIA